MEIIRADWEKRNLGVDTFEVTLHETDSESEVESAIESLRAEYIIVKSPSAKFEFNMLLGRMGFVFIESTVSIVNRLQPVEYSPVERRLIDAVSALPMDEADLQELYEEIRGGLFELDRVSLDPHFTNEQATNRYIHWIGDELARGTQFYKYVYKGKAVAFTSLRELGEGVYTSVLGGYYKGYRKTGLGAAVDKTPDIARGKGAKKLYTDISSNNPAQLKAELRHGYSIERIQNVFIQHTKPQERKTAIITGASRGIGHAMVKKFAQAGYDIWACASKPNAEFEACMAVIAKEHGAAIKPIYFDLASEEAIKQGFKQIYADKRPIHVLVNNAGLLHIDLFQRTSMAAVREIYEVNVFAAMYLCQLTLKAMVRQKCGNIINIASASALDPNITNNTYGSSKAALISFSQSLASEVAPHNIRINAIAPSAVDTGMLHRSKEVHDYHLSRSAMNRFATPEEIADIALYLASDQSSYITGQVIRADGGAR